MWLYIANMSRDDCASHEEMNLHSEPGKTSSRDLDEAMMNCDIGVSDYNSCITSKNSTDQIITSAYSVRLKWKG